MIQIHVFVVLALVILGVSSCGTSGNADPTVTPHTAVELTPRAPETTVTPIMKATPAATRTIILPSNDTPSALIGPAPEKPYGRLPFSVGQWKTNFHKTLVDYDLIVYGPRRDTVAPKYTSE